MIRKFFNLLFGAPNSASQNALALFARVVFTLVLFMLFWKSAQTKFDGFLHLSDGAYYQIFPKAFEAANFDSSAFPFWRKAIVWFGSVSELVLPPMIVLGLFTRLASLAMIGFVAVMTFTDVYGLGVEVGQWLDNSAESLIADQRLLWIALLAIPLVLGGGYLSLDQIFKKLKP